MNKIIKLIFILAGLAFLVYGGYQLIKPESSVDLGIAEIETQNNNNAYVVLGIGLSILLLGLIVNRKQA
ncbi:hypothetical protein [uncultured Tenacibaculum sp.]|uniref:hypothetical protein n=1 Tax=uncultured Tenacibaculum sp. TaxID=174713 RepID=UPI00261A5131|nr:hypothetical protein [uncultured Tenacibaculum sp.]